MREKEKRKKEKEKGGGERERESRPRSHPPLKEKKPAVAIAAACLPACPRSARGVNRCDFVDEIGWGIKRWTPRPSRRFKFNLTPATSRINNPALGFLLRSRCQG